jgi:hypothetical protein
MEYLNPATLKLLTYLLYQEDLVYFGVLSDNDRLNFIKDVSKHKLDKAFFFTISFQARNEAKDKIIEMHNSIMSAIATGEDKTNNQSIQETLSKIMDYTPNDPKLTTSEILSLINLRVIDNGLITFPLIVHINKPNIAELYKYLASYMKAFEQNTLISMDNFYSFEKHLMSIPENVFKRPFEEYGKTFTINERLEKLNTKRKEERTINGITHSSRRSDMMKCLRFYELLFYLETNKYINIIECSFDERKSSYMSYQNTDKLPEKYYYLNIKITLNKTPEEIYDISKYWLYYGDIRVNESDAVAYYKENRYPFKAISGKAFKLLCYLVEHHGDKIPIKKAYSALTTEADDRNDKEKAKDYKKKIKDYVKEIKKNLGILKDKNPSADIMVIEDSVILIANPPKK